MAAELVINSEVPSAMPGALMLLLAFAVATLASYVALDLARRVRVVRTRSGGLWLFGKLLYKGKEALARGDITIAAMVGAGAAACAAQALVAGVLLGGLFAIGMLVVRRSRHEFMPYGPGLCLGGLAALFVC